MSLCQKLYESGSITYPRTENTTYSDDFRKKMVEFIIMENTENNM